MRGGGGGGGRAGGAMDTFLEPYILTGLTPSVTGLLEMGVLWTKTKQKNS